MSYRTTDDLDPRLTPARDDLAASWLKEHVKVPRYIDPSRQEILVSVANIYRSPNVKQAIETQFLFGEPVDVLEVTNGWAWVQSARDGYVGCTEAKNLRPALEGTAPTHRISNIGSFIYPEATIKSTPLQSLSYNSLIHVAAQKNDLYELSTGGFVPVAHTAAIDFAADEIVAEAFRFLGVPYLWGGRSHLGLDCSGLVQLVLHAHNLSCPRDSDLQEKHVGKPVDRDTVQAGDLVFFRGHVGLMVDDATLIHANDRAMAVSIDDLDEYVHWRSKNGKTPVKMFKRVG